MIIYIRHSDDNDRHPVHRHDQKINKKGKILAYQKAQRLIKKYGHPTIMYISPFVRSKETAHEMAKAFTKKIDVYYDKRLSRFFSKKEQQDPSVFQSTLKHNIPIKETSEEFKQRVQNHIDSMEKRKYKKSSKDIVWCITHALVYKKVARYYHISIPKYIPFVEHFKVPTKKIDSFVMNPSQELLFL